MPDNKYQQKADNYDPRWFIWTIVFLVVTGVALTGYIALSDSGINDSDSVMVNKNIQHKPAPEIKNQK